MNKPTEDILSLIRSMDDLCRAMIEDMEQGIAKGDHSRESDVHSVRLILQELSDASHEIPSEALELRLEDVSRRLRKIYQAHHL